jgi:hypothetical protein
MARRRQYADPAARQRAYRSRLAQAREEAGLGAAPAAPRRAGEGRWRVLLAQAEATVEGVCAEMEAHLAERSEAWQESERGERFQERVESLQEALERLGEART